MSQRGVERLVVDGHELSDWSYAPRDDVLDAVDGDALASGATAEGDVMATREDGGFAGLIIFNAAERLRRDGRLWVTLHDRRVAVEGADAALAGHGAHTPSAADGS